jgi:hypothetical protein
MPPSAADLRRASVPSVPTVEVWPRLAARLAPVIGARGVEALFSRSVYQTSLLFPWLVVHDDGENGVALLDSIRARFVAQDAYTAAEANRALLLALTELLTSLIGESLTKRLLDPVCAPGLSPAEKEIGS